MGKNEDRDELQLVYIVTARSYDTKGKTKEISNDNSGVLRVFTNKEDAKEYMLHHYSNTNMDNCYVSLHENKNGILKMTVHWEDNVSLGTEDEWLRSETLECQTVELTESLKLEESTVMDDIATVLWGM